MIRIRQAAPADLHALLVIEAQSFTCNRLSRRSMRYALANPQALLLVAEERGIAGYLLLFQHQRSRRARIYSLAVDPARRGQGVAKALLKAAEAQCNKPGLKLELRTDNDPARRLYEKMGYHTRRSIPNFYEDGCAAWEMVKDRDSGI